MAAYVWCDGHPLIINLDNVDVIKIGGGQGYYLIEFFRSERTSKKGSPIFVAEWKFLTQEERDETLKQLMKEHGTTIGWTNER
jgi:hypothetical protein